MAFLTFKSFFSSVYLHKVMVQVTFLNKSLITFLTFMRFFSRMSLDMVLQRRRTRISFWTQVALIRFFPSVPSFMVLQTLSRSQCLFTKSTFELDVTSMYFDMSHQTRASYILPATDDASVTVLHLL